LVAEDDDEMRKWVAEALGHDGYEVLCVKDGGRLLVTLAQAIREETLKELADLIVSDVRMPICSGMQILEQLRAAHRRLPVILMTAFGDETMRDRARSLDAVLLDKPFELEDLRRAVAFQLGATPFATASFRDTRGTK
jgi:DNA-binding response OmpR family regulator